MTSFNWKDFLTFRRMVAPIIIEVLFWIGIAFCIFSGFYEIFHGDFLAGIGTLIVGSLMVRVVCELFILFFRMNETLTDIKNK